MTRHDLLRPLSLWARYWPQLAACYLLGLLARRATIELAAWAGYDNDWWASLIMPMAGVARLGSYVAMFLVLRPALPALAPAERRGAQRVDIFTSVIVPFFAIYLAWRLFREDWLAFETRALDYRIGDAVVGAVSGERVTELNPGSLPVGATTWILIAGALVIRWALGRVKDRLPTWMVAVRIYVDALWVFLVLSFSVNQGLTVLINPTKWIAQRRIMVWFSETRGQLFSHVQPLETVWDTAMWILRTAFGGVAVPLMWLAVAGIVYGVGITADWRGAVQRMAGRQAGELMDRSADAQTAVRSRWLTLPKYVRDKGTEHATAQLGKFKPITDAARVIMHAGIPALALYVLAYIVLAWLDMTGAFYGVVSGDGYPLRGMAWVLGPHPQAFWSAFNGTLTLISHLIIEPLRICLIASTFAYCVENVRRTGSAETFITPVAP
jgi:hypothetical protein